MDDSLHIIGQTLQGRYRIDAFVGEGGYGFVYKAFHIHLEIPIALKFLKLSGRETPEDREHYIAAFDEEAKLLLELSSQHPAFVRVLDLGRCRVNNERADTPFIVMEWLDGHTLDADLKYRRRRKLPPQSLEEVLRCLSPIAEALAVAHGQPQRIAHRDIKPANIFLSKAGEASYAKLLDFGIAKVMNATGEGAYHATTVGAISGFTPMYAAPEQWKKSFGATGPWTDVYALALVCVEMLTGKPALPGDDALQLMAATVDPKNRPTPRNRGAIVSSRVEAVFRKALTIEAIDRYSNAEEFWTALLSASKKRSAKQWLERSGAAWVLGMCISAGIVIALWPQRQKAAIYDSVDGGVRTNAPDGSSEMDIGETPKGPAISIEPFQLAGSAAPSASAPKIRSKVEDAIAEPDASVEVDAAMIADAEPPEEDDSDPYAPEPKKEVYQDAGDTAIDVPPPPPPTPSASEEETYP